MATLLFTTSYISSIILIKIKLSPMMGYTKLLSINTELIRSTNSL